MESDDGSLVHSLKKGSLLLGVSDAVQDNISEGNLPTTGYTEATPIDSGELLVSEAIEGSGKGITEFTFEGYGLKLVTDSTDVVIDKSKGEGVPTTYHSTVTWNLVSGL